MASNSINNIIVCYFIGLHALCKKRLLTLENNSVYITDTVGSKHRAIGAIA
jgi:hypothetical protein